ncbi:2'-5' RNA ligase superfamily protein [Mycolicibacterium rutilum]|uniref:2'-5' RNA ligase superfamily protein n=1 Tax=Mycolicibacterium rutilum TaxID=370526 RepID=A0A1H6L6E9_MYCRU|nr:2'-5' RNA ligase family protein [Mycolicibacterium rutilum]SEH80781.1 2'-5' RNA ligase superfamily protein [Mycolicibacterium rutilum]
MVHSVELVFDEATDAAVRRCWDDLMRAGVRSQAGHTSPSNRPHVTLTVAEEMADTVDDALVPVLDRLPLPCTIGAPMLFGGRVFTLVRLVVPSADLLALHTQVHEACLPHMPKGALPHADPGHWTPHVTLARRLPPEQLATALSLRSVGRDLSGRIVGLRHWDGNNRVEHPISRA